METVQQNGRFTLFSSKFPSNIYSILYEYEVSDYKFADYIMKICKTKCKADKKHGI